MTLTQLLEQIRQQPDQLQFDQVIDVIDRYYDYQPGGFYNGLGDDRQYNAPGTNVGSSKIFAFAQLQQLNPQQTLQLFGDYYRQHVLGDPDGSDHMNIRRFMRHGWAGIEFEHFPLQARN